MSKEHERRFLLNGFPDIDDTAHFSSIKQGYIEMHSDEDSLRSRIVGGKIAIMGLKEGTGITRDEREAEIDLDLGRKILDKSHHQIVKAKVKYRDWEIHIFGDVLAGIILAEKEFRDPRKPLVIPAWLKPFIIREVTDSLTSLHLARLATDLKGTNSSAPLHLEKHLIRIPVGVLTGGPGSGKSTLMELLKGEYPNVHFVPEVAAIVMGQLGIKPSINDPVSYRRFQSLIYRTQKLFELTSIQFAAFHGKKGVVLDRGKPDNIAYLPGGVREFEQISGNSIDSEFECYNVVVQMAVPPRKVYEKIKYNNPSRTETYDQAMILGRKIQDIWSAHPNYFSASSISWKTKVRQALEALNSHKVI